MHDFHKECATSQTQGWRGGGGGLGNEGRGAGRVFQTKESEKVMLDI